jgi:hypothetical protein
MVPIGLTIVVVLYLGIGVWLSMRKDRKASQYLTEDFPKNVIPIRRKAM